MAVFSTHPYLAFSLLLLGVFLVGLWTVPQPRRPTLLAALGSAPSALVSVFFVPEYWQPTRVATLLTGLEDIIFSFATGGTMWLLGAWPMRHRLRFQGSTAWAQRYTVCGLAEVHERPAPELELR